MSHLTSFAPAADRKTHSQDPDEAWLTVDWNDYQTSDTAASAARGTESRCSAALPSQSKAVQAPATAHIVNQSPIIASRLADSPVPVQTHQLPRVTPYPAVPLVKFQSHTLQNAVCRNEFSDAIRRARESFDALEASVSAVYRRPAALFTGGLLSEMQESIAQVHILVEDCGQSVLWLQGIDAHLQCKQESIDGEVERQTQPGTPKHPFPLQACCDSGDETSSDEEGEYEIYTLPLAPNRSMVQHATAHGPADASWGSQTVYYEAKEPEWYDLTPAERHVTLIRPRSLRSARDALSMVPATSGVEPDDFLAQRILPVAWMFWIKMEELRQLHASKCIVTAITPSCDSLAMQNPAMGALLPMAPLSHPNRLSNIFCIWRSLAGASRKFFEQIVDLSECMEEYEVEDSLWSLEGIFPLLACDEHLRDALAQLIIVLQP